MRPRCHRSYISPVGVRPAPRQPFRVAGAWGLKTRQAPREVIEVIDLILDFTVPPHQIRRLWRHQGLRITARFGEDRGTPGACMAHYPTDRGARSKPLTQSIRAFGWCVVQLFYWSDIQA